MVDINEIYEMIEFYADKLDFNNLLCDNELFYLNAMGELGALGVKIKEIGFPGSRLGRLKGELHGVRTLISKTRYLINKISEPESIKKELHSILEKEKEKKEPGSCKLNASAWGVIT